VPAKFDYGDRSPLNMIAELEVPEYGKEILMKLFNEYGEQWHKELDEFYNKDVPKWEVDSKFIDSLTGLAKVDLPAENQMEINRALKNASRPFLKFESSGTYWKSSPMIVNTSTGIATEFDLAA
jgi:hypothetical protein